MKLRDCDYILDKKDRFWILKRFDKKIHACLVFSPDKKGDRYNKFTKKQYSKTINQDPEIREIDKKEIKRIFRPENCFKNNYNKLPGIWGKMARCLLKYVNIENLGIFGSFLIGFEIKKDVDFVVYGKDNCYNIKKNIEKIRKELNALKISKRHIIYQKDKYGKFHSQENDFMKLLKNKWSSLQIRSGVLSTIRFVYKENEFPKDPNIKRGKNKIISGIATYCFGTNFVPRIFYVKTKKSKIRVLTYYWAYQACVKDNQKLKIFGEFNNKNKTIYISKPNHWIKIMN